MMKGLAVRAEGMGFMNVSECVMSAQQNKPIMGLVYDALSAVYMLTAPGTQLSREDFDHCIMTMTNIEDLFPPAEDPEDQQGRTLTARLARYRVRAYSGRALFSALLPADFYYNKGDVLIIDGVLVSGIITKEHVGTAHRSIIQDLWHDPRYGPKRVTDFLTDAPFVLTTWLGLRGLSVGFRDCFIPVKRPPRRIMVEGKEVILPPESTPADEVQQIQRSDVAKLRLDIEALGPPRENPIDERFRQRQITGILKSQKGTGTRVLKQAIVDPYRQITDFIGEYDRFSAKYTQPESKVSIDMKTLEQLRKYADQIVKISNVIRSSLGAEMSDLDTIRLQDEKKSVEDTDPADIDITTAQANIRQTVESLVDNINGLTESSTRQEAINNITALGQLSRDLLDIAPGTQNAFAVMTDVGSGAKGTLTNIAQITASVGQQFLLGSRLKKTLAGGTRFLSSYDPNDADIRTEGFIESSYGSGLQPEELFSLFTGGREGLLNTALKTSETGSLSHRMVKALEDVKISYDGSMRNATNKLFQQVYGGDGMSAGEIMKVKLDGFNDLAFFVDPTSLAKKLNSMAGWIPEDIVKMRRLPKIVPLNTVITPAPQSSAALPTPTVPTQPTVQSAAPITINRRRNLQLAPTQ